MYWLSSDRNPLFIFLYFLKTYCSLKNINRKSCHVSLLFLKWVLILLKENCCWCRCYFKHNSMSYFRKFLVIFLKSVKSFRNIAPLGTAIQALIQRDSDQLENRENFTSPNPLCPTSHDSFHTMNKKCHNADASQMCLLRDCGSLVSTDKRESEASSFPSKSVCFRARLPPLLLA